MIPLFRIWGLPVKVRIVSCVAVASVRLLPDESWLNPDPVLVQTPASGLQ
jgi:hypothetical protein